MPVDGNTHELQVDDECRETHYIMAASPIKKKENWVNLAKPITNYRDTIYVEQPEHFVKAKLGKNKEINESDMAGNTALNWVKNTNIVEAPTNKFQIVPEKFGDTISDDQSELNINLIGATNLFMKIKEEMEEDEEFKMPT
jgi:hypothetical protein